MPRQRELGPATTALRRTSKARVARRVQRLAREGAGVAGVAAHRRGGDGSQARRPCKPEAAVAARIRKGGRKSGSRSLSTPIWPPALNHSLCSGRFACTTMQVWLFSLM
jgi:hypothetical protein